MFFKQKKESKPEVISEDTCASCGELHARPFKDGDTVFGPGQKCMKCSSQDTMTTAIYGVYPVEKIKN